MSRALVRAAKRVVVKVGSSSLTTSAGGLDADRVDALVDVLATEQREVVLVSSGAISAGLAPLGLTHRPRDLATLQACASVGQLLLAERYANSFARYSRTVGQVLLTSEDVIRRAHYRNARRTLERLLFLGVVPVLNENDTVATEEIRFSGNDRLAALVAHLIAADLLILLTDVDGVYREQPPHERRGRAAHRRPRGPPISRCSVSRDRARRASAPGGCRRRSTRRCSRRRRAAPP